jgi:hypothetical protein
MIKFGNPKNVFWEALLLTVVVFVFGLFLGLALERSRVESLNEYYVNSEIALVDVLALNNIVSLQNSSCDNLISSNIAFADRVYNEAKILEKYDSAAKLDENVKLVHKRYDLLRTLLWTNSIIAREKCEGNFSTVVYLYERESEDLVKRATQNVWSKVLYDLKQKKGSSILLIPIAVDENLGSLDNLVKRYNVSKFPAVIVNDNVIYDLKSVNELEEYMK